METKSPHFWWIIGLMVILIIILGSIILTNNVFCGNKIMEFISYSTAILSITLSIFAIQYTYVSNTQMQQQFEKINSAAQSIYSTSEELNHVVKKLDENIGNILEQLKKIDQHQQDISSQLSDRNDSQSNGQETNYI